MKLSCTLLALVLFPAASHAQSATQNAKPAQQAQIFRLANNTDPEIGREITLAILDTATGGISANYLQHENAIAVRGTTDEIAAAQRVIQEFDRPSKPYRLTWTLTETDQGKRIGVQHISTVLTPGARTNLKQGSKIPIATGSYDEGKNGSQTQFTYLDVGLSFDATLEEGSQGMRLKSKVEESSLAEDKTIMGVAEPVIRQTVLEGTSIIVPGKPLVLGGVDVPGSTRHLEIEALLEPAS